MDRPTKNMGSAVASIVSVLPWIAWLSQYKAITFSFTGLVLAYSWWRSFQTGVCDIKLGARLKKQRYILLVSTVMLIVSVFAAYALLPIFLWLDGTQL